MIPITEAIGNHDPTVKLIGFIDSCFGRPDASPPSDFLLKKEETHRVIFCRRQRQESIPGLGSGCFFYDLVTAQVDRL